MFCTRCGSQNADGTQFCSGCGSPVGSDVSVGPGQTPGAPSGFAPPDWGAGPAVVYAGFWLRLLAATLDSFLAGLLFVPFIILIVIMAPAMGGGLANASNETRQAVFGLFFLGYFGLIFLMILAGWLYFAGMESSRHQATLGKKVLRLKVTDLQGNRISFGRASGRYFGKWLSSMILNVGYIMAGFTEKKQALHDLLAGCLVVRE